MCFIVGFFEFFFLLGGVKCIKTQAELIEQAEVYTSCTFSGV